MEHHSVDLVWGNHDVVWMGAASGHAACICNVIRMAARYGNLATLENARDLAAKTYNLSQNRFASGQTSAVELADVSAGLYQLDMALLNTKYKIFYRNRSCHICIKNSCTKSGNVIAILIIHDIFVRKYGQIAV